MKLILENWRQYLTEQKISYSGVVLDEESKQKLLELPIPAGWEPPPDACDSAGWWQPARCCS